MEVAEVDLVAEADLVAEVDGLVEEADGGVDLVEVGTGGEADLAAAVGFGTGTRSSCHLATTPASHRWEQS